MATPESPVKIAWDTYQAAAAIDPYSAETKNKHAAYKRALTVARKKASANA